MSDLNGNHPNLPSPVDSGDSNEPLIYNNVAEPTQPTVYVPKPDDFDDEKGKMNTLEVFLPFVQ